MRNYEIMTISKKALGEEGFSLVSGLVREGIEKNGGKVLSDSNWGKRRFAYKIENETEGYYEVINFELSPAKLSSLKTRLSLIEGLVRYIINIEVKK
jgi:small subunit ribosomal protein S6